MFSTICVATFYAALPALWRDPLGIAGAFGLLAEHPNIVGTLFRGEIVRHPNIPWDYIPTWILITTPPAALILAAVGIAHVARICAADWRDALANSTARFGLLTVACLILPVAAAVALNSNIFNGWRHVYFLYAPICVLAAFGLRGLAALPKPSLRAAAYALTVVGIAVVAVEMIRLHPYQHEYFSPLLNKSDLADRWEMNYWRVSHKEALDALLEIQPSGGVAVMSPNDQYRLERNMSLVPPDDRGRFTIAPVFPSFQVFDGDGGDGGDAAIWRREVYGVPIVTIIDARAETEAAIRAILAAAGASAPLASGGGFDIYADSGALTYINEDCGEEDARGRFFLSIFPADRNDLPQSARDAGREHEALNFAFDRYGAILDGKCVIVPYLPGYPISRVETGQWLPGEGELWSAEIVASD